MIERYPKANMLHGSRSSTYEVIERYRCATMRSLYRSNICGTAE